jgi:hypothetical protein
MKYAGARSHADAEVAMQKLLEIAHAVEPVQDGRSTSRRSTPYAVCETRHAG